MKFVVIGGNGLIGSEVVANLRHKGHEAVAESPKTGINALTGEGLAWALMDVDVLIDLTGAFPLEDETVDAGLPVAAARTGIRHYVALSVVGIERLQKSRNFQAKLGQENTIRAAGVPHTIIRTTQLFESIDDIIEVATEGQFVRVSPALVQPVAAADIAALATRTALAEPQNGVIELAGPERISLDDLVRSFLRAQRDHRQVITDVHAPYFGAELNDRSLTPGENPHIGSTYFTDWMVRSLAQRKAHAPA